MQVPMVLFCFVLQSTLSLTIPNRIWTSLVLEWSEIWTWESLGCTIGDPDDASLRDVGSNPSTWKTSLKIVSWKPSYLLFRTISYVAAPLGACLRTHCQKDRKRKKACHAVGCEPTTSRVATSKVCALPLCSNHRLILTWCRHDGRNPKQAKTKWPSTLIFVRDNFAVDRIRTHVSLISCNRWAPNPTWIRSLTRHPS